MKPKSLGPDQVEAELRHGSTPFWGSKNCCAVLLIFGVLINPSESQGPDLNRDVADLQSAAWPLRHLGRDNYSRGGSITVNCRHHRGTPGSDFTYNHSCVNYL